MGGTCERRPVNRSLSRRRGSARIAAIRHRWRRLILRLRCERCVDVSRRHPSMGTLLPAARCILCCRADMPAASARHCRENVTPNPDPDPISAVGDEAGGKSRLSLLKAHCPSPHRRRQLGHIMERIVLNGVVRSPSILRPIGETDELHVNRPSYLRSATAGQRTRSPFAKGSRI
jgi:hypothetical protein